MTTSTLADVAVTSAWSDLTVTDAGLVSTDATIQNVGNGPVAIVWGGADPSAAGKSGIVLGPRETTSGNAANVWCRSIDAAGSVAVVLGTGPTQAISGAVTATGNVAAGASDSGAPLKIGGYGSSSAPTAVTNAQRVNAWFGLNGPTIVGGPVATGVDGQANNSLTGLANALNGGVLPALVAPVEFNGSTWDRRVKPNAVSRLLSAAATTNATSVKASAGNLFRIKGYNAKAAAIFFKLYNKATAPTVGTDTPIATYRLEASGPFEIAFDAPQYFGTGIAYAITGAAADADTTALVAGDVVALNLHYA